MKENVNSEALKEFNLQPRSIDNLQKNRVKIGVVILTGLILSTGVFYVGVKVGSNKNVPNSSQPIIQETRHPSATPTLIPSPQEVVKPAAYQKTPVTSPEKYGFTETLELKGIGVKAKFPQNVDVSLPQENFYVAKVSPSDEVTFALKDYDGRGRRTWFQREYKYYKDSAFELFNGVNHSGYIAYSKTAQGPGSYFYFTAVNSSKMLVIHGTNNIIGEGFFFGRNLEKFKSFLSTVEIISSERVVLETFPQQFYRWSNNRKTVWGDSDLGLKIIAPEWTESRYTRERDIEGKYTYTDWVRVYPEAKTYDSSYFSESIKQVEVTGAYISSQHLSVLSSKYQGKSFSEVVNELLIPAGFCTTEWKSSKSECASSDFCYTKEEVLQNLVVKKQVKIGSLEVQLRGMNQDFSSKNDCRSEETWLIKAKNGLFMLSNISPEGESFRLETF